MKCVVCGIGTALAGTIHRIPHGPTRSEEVCACCWRWAMRIFGVKTEAA